MYLQTVAAAEYERKESKMNIELTETDIIFIYGHFKKQLAEFEKIANAANCPFDHSTIENQKAPYLSVIEKLSSQIPNLSKMDKYF